MRATNWLILLALAAGLPSQAAAQQAQVAAPEAAQAASPLPPYLNDRGRGIATSMFGTYIQRGELIIYPIFEGYKDSNLEYKPEEFGYTGSEDFRGNYRAKEGLLFVAYGFTDRLAAEFEFAAISATFEKSPTDPSGIPSVVKQSGLGDVEGQLRFRWRAEDARRPEVFSYFEAVVPHDAEKYLIGTDGWELKFGTGIIRGYRWGTITARAAVEYATSSTSPWDIGEYGLEYLKRLSPSWRIYLGLEGTQDELSLITEAQWHVSQNAFIRLNNGLGVTSKATDWAPEIGIVFTIPTR